MEMTASEIVTSYKGAKDKKNQITILAQLNCCDEITIKELLRQNGIEISEPKRRGRPSTKDIKNNEDKMVENGSQYSCEEPVPLMEEIKVFSIPAEVRKVCDDRIADITKMIAELQKERAALLDFLLGA